METTRTDQHAAERGAIRSGWLLALGATLLVVGITVLEVWAMPPRWLLPARQRTVDALHWTRAHWLSAAAITAAATVATALAPPISGWVTGRINSHPLVQIGDRRRQARQRTVMLRRVRY